MKAKPYGFVVLALALAGALLAGRASGAGSSNEILKPYVYRAGPPTPDVSPVSTAPAADTLSENRELPDLADARRSTPLRMPAYQVQSRRDRSFRDVNEAIAHENLLAPCALGTRELHRGAQLRIACAPIDPMPAETAGERLQARFPVLSVGW